MENNETTINLTENVSSANITDGNNDDYTTYVEYKAGELIWQIVPPILIILGSVGNCLSILVLTRRCIRSSTTALYLTVLAFSDLFVLYTGLLRQWLIYLFEVDVREVSEFGCKLNIWLVYSSLDFSAWILIVVTLERVISAWFPHNAKTLCTKKWAISLLVAVAVFILLLNAHLLYGMVFIYSVTKDGRQDVEKCIEINEDYRNFFNVSWPWIDFCAFCFIPFTVLVIGNALILFKVLKSHRKVKSRVVPSIHSGNRATATSKHVSKQSSMTAMLFTLNVVFLLSTSPISIYNIGYPYWSENVSAHKIAQLDFWWAIVNMLMYMNNSLNFLLYCLSGTKFRREVVQIFCSWRQGGNASNFQRSAQSSYTRTRFDTPSPSPSPKNSTIFTVNSSLSSSSHQINDNFGTSEIKNGLKTFKSSNNSLHPNDALKIVSVKACSNVDVETKEPSEQCPERRPETSVESLERKQINGNASKLENKEGIEPEITNESSDSSENKVLDHQVASISLNNIPSTLNTENDCYLTDLANASETLSSERQGPETKKSSKV